MMISNKVMCMVDYKKVNEIEQKLNELGGYELVHVVRHSQHEDDSWLYNIIAYNRLNDTFTTWLYGRGLEHGHYDITTLKGAYQDLADRMY